MCYLHVQYKTERNGVIETRVEQKITIQSDGDPIDHDRALAEAIQVRLHLSRSIKNCLAISRKVDQSRDIYFWLLFCLLLYMFAYLIQNC